MIIIWIIVSIILFSIIVIIHELWHFSAARFFGVKVDEFWLGIPPRARKLFTDKKWTLFSLNWLPLGWFVRLKWENSSLLKNKKDKDALINVAYYKQAIIILWWVFMNFLLAAIIFSILFMIWVKPIWINTKIDTDLNVKIIPTYEQAISDWFLLKSPGVLLSPVEWSIAEQAGIEIWDVLSHINNQEITTPKELIETVWKSAWEKIDFTIKKINGEIENIVISPSPEGKIGSYVSENITLNKDFEYKYSFLNAMKYGFIETYNQSLLTFKWLGILVKKIFTPETPNERQEALAQVSGPVWIVDFITNALSEWIIFLLIIWAIISINLGVFNLLPIPALDGWRFVFIFINGVIKSLFWKKIIGENTQSMIHIWFFILLIALSIIIMYNDIIKIINN